MCDRIEHCLADHFLWEGWNPQEKEAQRKLLFGVDRTGEDLLNSVQDAQEAGAVGIVPSHLGAGYLIDVVYLVLRAHHAQSIFAGKQQHACVGNAAFAHGSQGDEQIGIAQGQKV
jgi:hypothetical protein